MAGDPYRRVRPGEKVKIPALAWTQLMRGLVSLDNTGGDTIEFPESPYNWVYFRNDSGSTIPRWGVATIAGVASTPVGTTGAAVRQFESMPVRAGGGPTGAAAAIGVAVEPIPAGGLGRLAVAGAVQVRGADMANVGSAMVLYQSSDWGLVVLGGSGIRLGTISATWSKGSTATVTQQSGDGTAITPTTTFTASNYFATITVSSGTKRVACALAGSTWVLIAAEC